VKFCPKNLVKLRSLYCTRGWSSKVL